MEIRGREVTAALSTQVSTGVNAMWSRLGVLSSSAFTHMSSRPSQSSAVGHHAHNVKSKTQGARQVSGVCSDVVPSGLVVDRRFPFSGSWAPGAIELVTEPSSWTSEV